MQLETPRAFCDPTTCLSSNVARDSVADLWCGQQKFCRLLQPATVHMAEPKKEAYRAYLESAGVIESLTKGVKRFALSAGPGQMYAGKLMAHVSPSSREPL